MAGVPAHTVPTVEAVAVIWIFCTVLVALTTLVKAGILPDALVGFTLVTPAGTVACHAKVTPGVVEFNVTAALFAPLQMD